MGLTELSCHFPNEVDLEIQPRPYVNHSVQFKKSYTADERMKKLEEVGLNVFFFPAEMVTGCDFLSDSGVTTMTSAQWAALHDADESYGSNRGYFLLRDEVHKVFGKQFWNEQGTEKPNAFLFHQGRPCEDALFSVLGKLGKDLLIPSNGHFDTTHANIAANGITPVNLFSGDLKDEDSDSRFKGNMDIARLEKLLATEAQRIPLVYMTVTNNTGGGQPVSLENIREAAALAHTHKLPFFLDACRFAENAWFIQRYEEGYSQKTILEIVHEMFSYADGFTISFKKDGLVNMGGGLFLRAGGLFMEKYPKIPDDLMNFQIIKEGHPSYGGMSGRDIMTLVVGLQFVTREGYLNHRIGQVADFGGKMQAAGLPVLTPFGGHAVYLDMNRFFADTALSAGDFGGISFTAILLAQYGHRACELGNFAFGEYDAKTKEEKFPEVNFVRFAVPRLRYEAQDLAAAVEAVQKIYSARQNIPAIDVIHGKELALRHFKAQFRFRS